MPVWSQHMFFKRKPGRRNEEWDVCSISEPENTGYSHEKGRNRTLMLHNTQIPQDPKA